MHVLGRDRVSSYYTFKYLGKESHQMTTAIAINNGAASPVLKTFAVARSASGEDSAILLLREGQNQTEFPKLEFSSKSTQVGSTRGRKSTTTELYPYGTLVNGVFVKTNHISVVTVITVLDDAPDAIRKDAAAFHLGFQANQQVKDLTILGFAS